MLWGTSRICLDRALFWRERVECSVVCKKKIVEERWYFPSLGNFIQNPTQHVFTACRFLIDPKYLIHVTDFKNQFQTLKGL